MNKHDILTVTIGPFAIVLFWLIARYAIGDARWTWVAVTMFAALRLVAHFEPEDN